MEIEKIRGQLDSQKQNIDSLKVEYKELLRERNVKSESMRYVIRSYQQIGYLCSIRDLWRSQAAAEATISTLSDEQNQITRSLYTLMDKV
jgi:hypothetical protein